MITTRGRGIISRTLITINYHRCAFIALLNNPTTNTIHGLNIVSMATENKTLLLKNILIYGSEKSQEKKAQKCIFTLVHN